ncbi:PLP-dependent transferase, partial [Escherichia coli]|uniref:PLP-dependent transferase n=1 Tax=Escherichia coli TaxID=562 RepID=UPI002076F4BC
LAESLGGVESLISHAATMTHAGMAPEARAAAGISETLLRISTPRTNFSDNCQVVRVRIKRFADNLIGDVRTIKVAGINMIDA